jgi:hypothetical protein
MKASTHNLKWDRGNRSVTDDEAAEVLANGHPKSHRPQEAPYPSDAQVLPGSPGSGAAPGANGPPTTGPTGGSLGST